MAKEDDENDDWWLKGTPDIVNELMRVYDEHIIIIILYHNNNNSALFTQ